MRIRRLCAAFFAANLYYPPWHDPPPPSYIPYKDLHSPALQAASWYKKQASCEAKRKYKEKTFLHDFLHCHLDFSIRLRIIDVEGYNLQDILQTDNCIVGRNLA
jgi:hypothetical protein